MASVDMGLQTGGTRTSPFLPGPVWRMLGGEEGRTTPEAIGRDLR